MSRSDQIAGWCDKPLFTPGPLTTSRTVKQAMLRDLGSRDFEFIETVREVRQRLLDLGGVSKGQYEAILVQGSGTFAVESVISSVIPQGGKLLTLINGAYGHRIVKMASVLRIETAALEFPENAPTDPTRVAAALAADPKITHVATVHCETTTGLVNPVEGVGAVVRQAGRVFIVDAMSSFGAIPIRLAESGVDFLVSSANKCIEGVPGFGFVLAGTQALRSTEGYARSLSLDLLAQWKGLEANGQFRFTPPTHVISAFAQALRELDAEGGVPGRAARYRKNHQTLIAGMRAMGFREYLDPALQGYVITSFLYPEHERFGFEEFYSRLNEQGYVIYPGKVSNADCFRIGTIGRLFESDVRNLLLAIQATCRDMKIDLPLRV